MSDLKPSLALFLTGAAAAAAMLAISCAAPAPAAVTGLPNRIAFSSDRNDTVHVYTCKADGTDVANTGTDNQTLDGSPSWSADGARIAFSSNESDDWEIWTMKADGSDRKKLTARDAVDTSPRYSPDGTKIVFVGEFKDTNVDREVDTYEIMTVNSDGSGMARLTTSPKIGKGSWNSVPIWSPDGKKILFSSNREGNGVMPVLYTMDPDGNNQQKFGFPFSIEGTQPDWSPVTNKIVFVKGSAAKGEIWVMDAGSPFPGLTAKKLTDNFDNNQSPVWSPDGKQIAYVADTYGNDNIFVMNADGSGARRVTFGKSNDRHPSWR